MTFHNPKLTKGYEAAAEIQPRRIVAQTGDFTVARADVASAALIGITDRTAVVAAGAMADVHELGVADVDYGGPLTWGDPITADVDGKAIKAVPAQGEQLFCIGFAAIAGVAGDIGSARLSPFILTGV